MSKWPLERASADQSRLSYLIRAASERRFKKASGWPTIQELSGRKRVYRYLSPEFPKNPAWAAILIDAYALTRTEITLTIGFSNATASHGPIRRDGDLSRNPFAPVIAGKRIRHRNHYTSKVPNMNPQECAG